MTSNLTLPHLHYQVFSMRRYQEFIAPYVRLLPHDNICRIAEVITGEHSVFVFFQRNYGDMHSYVRTCKRLQEEEAVLLFSQMAVAVAHCHEHGVVLRDLKLRKFVFVDQQRLVVYALLLKWQSAVETITKLLPTHFSKKLRD